MNKKIGTAGAVVAVTLVGIIGATSCDSPDTSKPVSKTASKAVHVPSMSEKIQTWYLSVSPELDRVIADLEDASTAADILDESSMTSACLNGVSDTITLAGKDPYPANSPLWKDMLRDLDSAFTTCAAGDYTNSTIHFREVTSDLEFLNTDVDKYK